MTAPQPHSASLLSGVPHEGAVPRQQHVASAETHLVALPFKQPESDYEPPVSVVLTMTAALYSDVAHSLAAGAQTEGGA